MPRAEEIPITPSVLAWARQRAGLTLGEGGREICSHCRVGSWNVISNLPAARTACGVEFVRTLRWREMDSNFQYAGAVNLVVGPFGWVVLIGCGSGRGASGTARY
jgi:hypothetical protein